MKADEYRQLLAYAIRARDEATLWAERLQGKYPVAADRCLLVAEIQGRMFTDAGQRAGEVAHVE